ncbi:hypothetical protein DFJ73DRAFT_2468 [Zopfochytrium polystomum]|nr:hypothetical protein DFJ73DRAFT_2468 [Zopfochytrium polystomum]
MTKKSPDCSPSQVFCNTQHRHPSIVDGSHFVRRCKREFDFGDYDPSFLVQLFHRLHNPPHRCLTPPPLKKSIRISTHVSIDEFLSPSPPVFTPENVFSVSFFLFVWVSMLLALKSAIVLSEPALLSILPRASGFDFTCIECIPFFFFRPLLCFLSYSALVLSSL